MNVLRLTLRQLQILVAVVETGSTSAASERLALSQSATSAALNELERLLSLRLFDRVGKRLVLNEHGRAIWPKARAMLDCAAGIERMALPDLDPAQTLRIGASTTLGNHVLPALLAQFLGTRAQQHPHWCSRASIDNTARISRAVAAFELDIGLIEGPCHEPALCVEPWLQDELLVVASASPAGPWAALAAQGTVPEARLADAVWLLRESGSGTREATDQVLLPRLHSYRRSIELGSSEAIRQGVIQGLGLACLSRWAVADSLASGQLIALPTPWPTALRQCYWVLHRDKQPTPTLQRFIDLVRQAAYPCLQRSPTSPDGLQGV